MSHDMRNDNEPAMSDLPAIDNPLLECKRSGAEVDNVNEEFTLQAH